MKYLRLLYNTTFTFLQNKPEHQVCPSVIPDFQHPNREKKRPNHKQGVVCGDDDDRQLFIHTIWGFVVFLVSLYLSSEGIAVGSVFLSWQPTCPFLLTLRYVKGRSAPPLSISCIYRFFVGKKDVCVKHASMENQFEVMPVILDPSSRDTTLCLICRSLRSSFASIKKLCS